MFFCTVKQRNDALSPFPASVWSKSDDLGFKSDDLGCKKPKNIFFAASVGLAEFIEGRDFCKVQVHPVQNFPPGAVSRREMPPWPAHPTAPGGKFVPGCT